MSIHRAKGVIPVALGAGASEDDLLDLARFGAERLAETERGVVVGGPWMDDVTRLYHFSADIEVPD